MSGQLGESKINEVRERTDIIELVSQYVSLKRSGTNHMGLCPFHSEKSPSFSVHAGRQFFHCFGCGVGGDVFSFLMKIEGLAFPDALRRLAERAGIDLEERQLSAEEEQQQQQRERLYRVNELAAEYFHQLLMEAPIGEAGRQYLKRRGYGRKAAAEYQIGYAADTWAGLTDFLEQRSILAEDARTLGLIRPGKQGRGDYDLFRGRLIFPIFDLSGRVVAFGGRVLDDSKPKYINSPESPIYHKGRVLYGLYQARQAMRQSGEVILVEGYFDQLALFRSGYPQVVASCGTALTVDHARLLKRYVQRVRLLFDQDPAGRQATFKAMGALQEEGIPTSVIELPAGEDPDSFVQRQGGAAFQQRLAQARPAMDLFMETALAAAGSAVEEKARAAETVLERLTALTSDLEQDLYLKELARRSGIDPQLLKNKLAAAVQRSSRARQRPSRPPPAGADEYPLPGGGEEPPATPVSPRQRARPLPPWSKTEQILLCLLMFNPAIRAKISSDGVENFFPSSLALQTAELLLTTWKGSEGDGEETFIARLDPHEAPFLKVLMAVDSQAYAGDQGAMLEDCRKSLLREKQKLQREELLDQIRRAEQSGDREQAKELMDKFTKLK